ncbi:MAG: glycosyltransferase, partial [Clostridiaceae bacterium]|nr:glycosyltransferase [Clostridiaceae bacterium]
MDKVLVIIPAYNEALNIERVVTRLQEEYPIYDYVIVNDGSADETAAICRSRGFQLIDLPVN